MPLPKHRMPEELPLDRPGPANPTSATPPPGRHRRKRLLGSLALWPTLIGAGMVAGSLITGQGVVTPAAGPQPTQQRAAADDEGPLPTGGMRDGASGDKPSLSGGAMWYPWAPGPGELGANPLAFSIDHVLADGRTAKRVVSSWGRNEDSPNAPLVNTRSKADDDGQIFEPYDALPSEHTMVATTRLRNGDVLSASFVPVPSPAPNRVAVPMARSTDAATTWDSWNAPIIEDKWQFGWYRVHRDLVELPDGTLLLGGYGKGTVDGVFKEYSILFQSTDGGRTFTQRSAINAGSEYSTNEMGFTINSVGQLVAVLRGTEPVPRPPAMPLTQTFSSDYGKTWEPVKPFVPPAGFPNNGIMPEPMLQANGQLLMTYGRPDNNVVVSLDGTGRTWDRGEMLFSRYPGEGDTRRWMGSSGNMALAPLNASASLAFGDTCHNIWMCREYGHDNKVWTRKVDAINKGTGRIDLKTKVLAGTVKLSGQAAAADPRFPEQRLEGSVDGSGEYRAAARLGNRQQLTVELDKEYTLNRIGLMMAKGESNSARIQMSTDGQNWGRPVAETGVRTDWAMKYHDFAPVKAKFVRITGAGPAPLGAVTELELFDPTVLTFENDAIASTPRDVTQTRYAYVADKGTLPGYDDSRARLTLVDVDSSNKATARFAQASPAASQRASFGFEGYGYGAGAIWDVLGTDASGKEVTAFSLHFAGDSANNAMVARVWDGTKWTEFGRGGPFIPNKAWMGITIESTPTGSEVKLNGTSIGKTDVKLADVKQFTGLRASTGLVPADVGNMEHSYDDVSIVGM